MKLTQENFFRYYLAAASLSLGVNGLFSIGEIFSLPSESANRILFGLSASRLFLLIIIGIIAGLSFYFSTKTVFRKAPFPKNFNTLNAFSLELILASSIFLWLSAWLALVLGHQFQDFQAFFIRLKPLIGLLFHFSLGAFIFLAIVGLSRHKDIVIPFPDSIKQMKLAGRIFGSMIILGLIIHFTQLGITPFPAYWGEAEAPVMGYQLILTLSLAGVFFLIYLLLKRIPRFVFFHKHLDKLVFIILWIVAAATWIHLPIQRNFFLPNPTAPNFDFYPYADAATYDNFAQSILIGAGFTNQEYAFRPIYVIFLALLHLFAKNNYALLIHLQMGVFALQVPFLYLLGKFLHRRATGLIIALTGILVESNSILASGHIQVTNSQLLLSEFPTGLLLLISAVFAIKWLKQDFHISRYFYLMGGFIGLSALIRLHTLLVLLGILALSVIKIKDLKVWGQKISVLVVFVFFIIFPWAFRNYLIIGAFSPDPNRLNLLLENRWDLENEGPTDLNSNSNSLDPDSHTTSITFKLHPPTSHSTAFETFTQEAPQIPGLILHHFFHNEILSTLMLPLSYQMEPLDSYFENTFDFNQQWSGELQTGEWILLGINMLFVSFGIASAFNRIGVAALVPLSFQLTYNLSNALARTSGWRYLKPTNWVVYTYFFIGIVELLVGLLFLISRKRTLFYQNEAAGDPSGGIKKEKSPWLLALAFIAITALVSFGPAVVEDRYLYSNRTNSLQALFLDELRLKLSPVEYDLVTQLPNKVFLIGRGVYPRFYPANEGNDHIQGAFYKLDFSRLEFYLIGKHRIPALIKMKSPPEYFPNGADSFLIGCFREKYIEAFAVMVVEKEQRAVYITDSPLETICP